MASFIAAISLAVILIAVEATTGEINEFVKVREVSSDRNKRTVDDFPENLHVQFQVDSKSVSLHLRQKRNIDMDVPVTFEGETPEKEDIVTLKDSSVYQDVNNMAAISVTAKVDNGGKTKRTLEGSFMMGGKKFGIEPADEEQQNREGDDEGRLHRVYQLSNGNEEPEDKYEHMHGTLIEKAKRSGRFKRATTVAAYHVEILLVLDHTVWKYYLKKANNNKALALQKLKYHYSHQVNGMDLAYKSIDARTHGFSITPFLIGYHIAKTFATSHWTATAIKKNVATDYTKTHVDAQTALVNIAKWSVQGGRTWTNPDHVILWTRYDVRQYKNGKSVSNPIGYAPVSGICQPGRSVSLVEDNGIHSWSTAAHELGHNLGAKHDIATSNGCTGNSQYIMAAVTGLTSKAQILNKYKFSSCSIRAFKQTLAGRDIGGWPRVCLTNRVCSHGVAMNVDKLPGVVYSLDEQCKLNFGPKYKFYRAAGDDICYALKCTVSGTMYFYRVPGAAQGTPCGNNKCCFRGKCVGDCSNPPVNTNAKCAGTGLPTKVPAGCKDVTTLRYTYNGLPIQCRDIPVSLPQLCFDNYIRPKCCASCHAAGVVEPTQHMQPITATGIKTTRKIATTTRRATTTRAPMTTTRRVYVTTRRPTTRAPVPTTRASVTTTRRIRTTKKTVRNKCARKRNGFYSIRRNCSLFYRCISRKMYKYNCKQLVFDPAIKGCNYPWAVKPRYLRRCKLIQ